MDVFVARQPIFDAGGTLYAYELLYRCGYENYCPPFDSDEAASRVISDTASVFGMRALTAGKKAFVNFTRHAITESLFSVLSPDSVVVELLETVEPDDEVIAACKALKNNGYLLALDDFEDRPQYAPLIELADFIKVDFLATDPGRRRDIARRYGSHVKLLAEKVETFEDVRQGLEHGYQFFQGFFFCKPEIISRRDIPGFKFHYLRFFEEVSKPEVDFRRLELIIEREVSLSVKLLRLLNSAVRGQFGGVNSVHQALLVLGERIVKKWASMIALTELGQDRPAELVATCLLRARFCELLGEAIGLTGSYHNLFLVGMLSLVDALIGRPLTEVLDELAVSHDIRDALIETDSPMGAIRALVAAHERGDWERVEGLSQKLPVSDIRIAELYRDAVAWVDHVFRRPPSSTNSTSTLAPLCA